MSWLAAATAAAGAFGFLGSRKNAQTSASIASANNATSKGQFRKSLKFQKKQFQRQKKEFGILEKERTLDRAREEGFAKESTGWAMQDAINTARENGLHPLAALGTQSQYQATGQSGAGSATLSSPELSTLQQPQFEEDYAALGNAISGVINELSPNVKASNDRNRRYEESQIALNEARAKSLEAEATALARDGRVSVDSEDFDRFNRPIFKQYTGKGGTTTEQAEGPDISEILGGLYLNEKAMSEKKGPMRRGRAAVRRHNERIKQLKEIHATLKRVRKNFNIPLDQFIRENYDGLK